MCYSRHDLRAKKLYFKKIHPRGKSCKYYTSRVLYLPFYPPHSPTFGTKPLPRRRFLQHYYRDTFIESHRKPIEVLEMSYSGRLTCSIFIPNTSKEFLYKSHQQITNSHTITCISANFSVPLRSNPKINIF